MVASTNEVCVVLNSKFSNPKLLRDFGEACGSELDSVRTVCAFVYFIAFYNFCFYCARVRETVLGFAWNLSSIRVDHD